MSYDAVIFDVDGTLWDAREPVAVGWNRALEQLYGQPGTLTGPELGQHFGIPTEEIIRIVLPRLPETEIPRYAKACFALSNQCCMETPGRFYPGVLETLPKLAKKLPLYIVSNCQQGYIECVIHGGKLEGLISGYLCWGDTLAPKAETIRQLMARHGLKHPVYVGDTQGDVEASLGAGIDVISVTYGLGQATTPQKTIDRFSQLLELLP
jgi:phosphoglycolate phosphatase